MRIIISALTAVALIAATAMSAGATTVKHKSHHKSHHSTPKTEYLRAVPAGPATNH
jgi:hypothetical protein